MTDKIIIFNFIFVFLLCFIGCDKPIDPPFHGTIFIDPNIINKLDPSCFVNLYYNGQDLRTMYDRREEGWIENYEEALLVSQNSKKPIFIDFTGYTCTNCRWMEKNVFVDKQVEELFEHFILVRLYTDGGPNHKEYQQMEIDRYGTAALPFYVVIDNREKEISRFPGMDTNVNKFIKFLEESLK